MEIGKEEMVWKFDFFFPKLKIDKEFFYAIWMECKNKRDMKSWQGVICNMQASIDLSQGTIQIMRRKEPLKAKNKYIKWHHFRLTNKM